MKELVIVFFAVGGLLASLVAWKNRKKSFFSNTPYLWWLGIYVWGDALVLGPFWMLSALFLAMVKRANDLKVHFAVFCNQKRL